ncbi:hypothetical protein FACS189419_07180 [Planctomycetales bacterium]|nr:hypothetical protein FACS189419_07180 [Planctomycetales bacterium]
MRKQFLSPAAFLICFCISSLVQAQNGASVIYNPQGIGGISIGGIDTGNYAGVYVDFSGLTAEATQIDLSDLSLSGVISQYFTTEWTDKPLESVLLSAFTTQQPLTINVDGFTFGTESTALISGAGNVAAGVLLVDGKYPALFPLNEFIGFTGTQTNITDDVSITAASAGTTAGLFYIQSISSNNNQFQGFFGDVTAKNITINNTGTGDAGGVMFVNDTDGNPNDLAGAVLNFDNISVTAKDGHADGFFAADLRSPQGSTDDNAQITLGNITVNGNKSSSAVTIGGIAAESSLSVGNVDVTTTGSVDTVNNPGDTGENYAARGIYLQNFNRDGRMNGSSAGTLTLDGSITATATGAGAYARGIEIDGSVSDLTIKHNVIATSEDSLTTNIGDPDTAAVVIKQGGTVTLDTSVSEILEITATDSGENRTGIELGGAADVLNITGTNAFTNNGKAFIVEGAETLNIETNSTFASGTVFAGTDTVNIGNESNVIFNVGAVALANSLNINGGADVTFKWDGDNTQTDPAEQLKHYGIVNAENVTVDGGTVRFELDGEIVNPANPVWYMDFPEITIGADGANVVVEDGLITAFRKVTGSQEGNIIKTGSGSLVVGAGNTPNVTEGLHIDGVLKVYDGTVVLGDRHHFDTEHGHPAADIYTYNEVGGIVVGGVLDTAVEGNTTSYLNAKLEINSLVKITNPDTNASHISVLEGGTLTVYQGTEGWDTGIYREGLEATKLLVNGGTIDIQMNDAAADYNEFNADTLTTVLGDKGGTLNVSGKTFTSGNVTGTGNITKTGAGTWKAPLIRTSGLLKIDEGKTEIVYTDGIGNLSQLNNFVVGGVKNEDNTYKSAELDISGLVTITDAADNAYHAYVLQGGTLSVHQGGGIFRGSLVENVAVPDKETNIAIDGGTINIDITNPAETFYADTLNSFLGTNGGTLNINAGTFKSNSVFLADKVTGGAVHKTGAGTWQVGNFNIGTGTLFAEGTIEFQGGITAAGKIDGVGSETKSYADIVLSKGHLLFNVSNAVYDTNNTALVAEMKSFTLGEEAGKVLVTGNGKVNENGSLFDYTYKIETKGDGALALSNETDAEDFVEHFSVKFDNEGRALDSANNPIAGLESVKLPVLFKNQNAVFITNTAGEGEDAVTSTNYNSLEIRQQWYSVGEYLSTNHAGVAGKQNASQVAKALSTQIYTSDNTGIYRNLTDAGVMAAVNQTVAGGENSVNTAQIIASIRPTNEVFAHLNGISGLVDAFGGSRGQVRGQKKSKGKEGMDLWFTSFVRYEKADADNVALNNYTNTHFGMLVGGDLSLYDRCRFGLVFGYGAPRLKNDTGKSEVDDLSFGFYYRVPIFAQLYTNIYVGYGSQSYTFKSLGTDAEYDGDSVSGSIQFMRDFQNGELKLTPLLGFEFSTVKTDPFDINTPVGRLNVGSNSLDQIRMKLGFNAEYWRVRGRLSWTNLLSGDKVGGTDVLFADTGAGTRVSGINMGSNWFSVGVGAKLIEYGNLNIYGDYDLDTSSRLTGHTGQLQAVLSW